MNAGRQTSFWTGALITTGAMVVALSGLCTAGVGAMTLPGVLFGVRADLYGLLPLVPSLVVGAAFIAGGAYIFWNGHDELKRLRRGDAADVVARIGYAATIAIGSLFAVTCASITVRMVALGLSDTDHGFDGLIGTIVIGGLATALCVVPVGIGLRGLRRLGGGRS